RARPRHLPGGGGHGPPAGPAGGGGGGGKRRAVRISAPYRLRRGPGVLVRAAAGGAALREAPARRGPNAARRLKSLPDQQCWTCATRAAIVAAFVVPFGRRPMCPRSLLNSLPRHLLNHPPATVPCPVPGQEGFGVDKSMMFTELGLSAELLRAVSEQGYSQPTPIQAQAIPVVLKGGDVLAGAQTGTGKTAGFTLPLLQRLSAGTPAGNGFRPVRALVLTPTRELAAQVGESVATYGKYLSMRSAVIFGGVNINPQISLLRKGVDILVATPGRLLDHVQQKTLDLSKVEILVLDE